MKKVIVFALLLMSSSALFAQGITKVSEPYKVTDGKHKCYIREDNFIYMVKVEDNSTLVMQKMDSKSLALIADERKKKFFPSGTIIFKVIHLEDKCLVFFDNYSKKENLTKISCFVVNYKEVTVEANSKLLATMEGEIYRYPYVDDCKLILSGDKSKILIQCHKKMSRDRMSEQTFGLYVFDRDLNKIGGGAVKMLHTWTDMDDLNYSVKNDGSIEVLGYYKPDNQYKIFTIDKETLKIKVTNTAFDKHSYFYEIATDNDNTRVVTGFKGNEDKQLFVLHLNKDELQEVDMPKEMTPYYKKTDRPNYIMNLKTHVLDDGSIIAIGQEFDAIEVYKDGRASASQSEYHFNDYYIVKITPDGKLAWAKRIDKQKKSTTSSFGAADAVMFKLVKFYPREQFKYHFDGDNHYLLFEDELKEEKNKRHLMGYKVDDEGNGGKLSVIFHLDKVEKYKLSQFKPYKIGYLGNSNFVIESYKGGKEDVMVKFKVDY